MIITCSTLIPSSRGGTPEAQRGGTLIGIFIGLVIGLSVAMGVAYYITKSGNPYQNSVSKETARTARPDNVNATPGSPDKPRFDFYKILPGVDEPKPGAQVKSDKSTTASRVELPGTVKSGPVMHLQAGAFANESEAENLKARLALSGLEAEILVANVPDKGVIYRVRLGPYDNVDEMNRIRNELGKRGFDAAVIKG